MLVILHADTVFIFRDDRPKDCRIDELGLNKKRLRGPQIQDLKALYICMQTCSVPACPVRQQDLETLREEIWQLVMQEEKRREANV